MPKMQLVIALATSIFSTLCNSHAVADPSDYMQLEEKVVSIVESADSTLKKLTVDMEEFQALLQNDSRFRDDDHQLYIFMHAYDEEKKEVVCVGHGVRPELLGKNMWGLRTPNGRLLFHEVMDQFEEKDQFWLEYDWLNPYKNEIQTKRSLYKKIQLKDGRSAWIGSGFWKN